MKIKTLAIITCISLAVSLILGINVNRINATTEYQVNANLDELMLEVSKLATEDPEKAMSSNPYTYIENNTQYDAIIELGLEALPYLEELLDNTEKNGLREYIIAIAIEDITMIDLKQKDELKWSTAREFDEKFNLFIVELEDSISETLKKENGDKQKTEELIEYGVLALPYLLEASTMGNSECDEAIQELLFTSFTIDSEIKDNSGKWDNAALEKAEYIQNISKQLQD